MQVDTLFSFIPHRIFILGSSPSQKGGPGFPLLFQQWQLSWWQNVVRGSLHRLLSVVEVPPPSTATNGAPTTSIPFWLLSICRSIPAAADASNCTIFSDFTMYKLQQSIIILIAYTCYRWFTISGLLSRGLMSFVGWPRGELCVCSLLGQGATDCKLPTASWVAFSFPFLWHTSHFIVIDLRYYNESFYSSLVVYR